MSRITWNQTGEKIFETGVDQGVLYIPNNLGQYVNGYGWNGLISVNESPSGAEPNKQYADNQVYVNLLSAEEFNATIEAFTYPDEFGQCDGTDEPVPGLAIGQQARKAFGLSYRTRIGNDLVGPDYGYKIHLVYGALAAPSEKANATINESPEAVTFSWEVSTTPVPVPDRKPTSTITIDSTKVDSGTLEDLEAILYGSEGVDPRLPLPAEVISMFEGTVTEATPTEPTFNQETNTITIPTVTGVVYKIGGEVVTGSVVIEANTVVTASPASGYKFPNVTDDDWYYPYEA